MDNQFLMPSVRHPNGYFFGGDSVLDGFTMDQLIDAVRCEHGPINERTVRKVLKTMFDTQLQDMNAIVDANMEEIIEAASTPDSDDSHAEPVFDPEWIDVAENLAQDIYKWCIENEVWIDVAIYYNGKRMSTSGVDENGKEHFRYNGEPFIEDGCDPRDYFRYARSPNILSMSFEGDLYDILNYGDSDSFYDLFKKYGLYYELGNAWNLTAVPND